MTAATARRCRVGRLPTGSFGSPGSVLVIVAPVGRVAVAVVEVVDVVAVRDSRVAAVGSVHVLVVLGYGGVPGRHAVPGSARRLLDERHRESPPAAQPRARRQSRGEAGKRQVRDAEHGFAINFGGFGNNVVATILSKGAR